MVSHADTEVLQASPATALIRERTVHFAGQPVALVAASSQQASRAAAHAIQVRLEARPAVTALAQASTNLCTGHGRRPAETRGDASRRWRNDPSPTRYDTVNNHPGELAAVVPVRTARPWLHRPGHLRHPRHDRACFSDAGIGHPRHLAFPRRRLRLQGAAVVAVDVLGDSGLQENRPPGSAGTDARAVVHLGRAAPGDGAGSGAGV